MRLWSCGDALNLSRMHWTPAKSLLRETVQYLFFSRHSDASLLVGPYAWANHKNPISFSLRKWRWGVAWNQTHITNCPLRRAIIRHIPMAICSLPVASPNDGDWSQIRILLHHEKSRHPAWEWIWCSEQAHSAVVREVIFCNLQAPGAAVINFQLIAKAELASSTSQSNLDGALMLSKRAIRKSCCYVPQTPHFGFFLHT